MLDGLHTNFVSCRDAEIMRQKQQKALEAKQPQTKQQ